MYKLVYTQKAQDDLDSLDITISQRIVKKISFFSHQENPLIFAKKLTDFGLGEYRFRIGNYRAIFEVDSSGNLRILKILRIKHRKDVYDFGW